MLLLLISAATMFANVVVWGQAIHETQSGIFKVLAIVGMVVTLLILYTFLLAVTDAQDTRSPLKARLSRASQI